ncbi:MAG: riboflavin synthase [Janthinobacterium lividum]
MFTGIIEAVGRIDAVEPLGAEPRFGVRLIIDAATLSLDDVAIGDSISIQGACMTVVEFSAKRFAVDVSQESLTHTAGLDAPGPVNLEKAMKPDMRLGGHLVSGHVDGLGRVTHFAPVGESWELRILAPAEIGSYLAYKGSVAVNGVSLTVNAVTDLADGTEISINLIPHTVEVTTLHRLAPGSLVNLEVDLIARYVKRMLESSGRLT